MKNLYKALASAAIVLLAASCVNEMGNDTADGLFRKYNLSFEGSTKTELSGTGSTRQVKWNDGDEINYYTVDKQPNVSTASVTVDGSSAFVDIPRGRNDDFINAVYGSGSLTVSSSTSDCMYVESPAKNSQSYTTFAQAHLCAAFSSDLEDPNLRFHNAVAILRITSASAISKVVFSGNRGEVITGGSNGSLKITYSGGAISSAPASTGGTSVTVTTGGQESDFYIAILPVNFSEGIIVRGYDASGYLLCERKTSGELNTVNAAGLPIIANLGSLQEWLDNPKPTAVDLGLSVKWASFNLGANKPEDYGDYFAWGETTPKNEYKWANYQFGNGKNGPFSKYVLDSTYGTIDHKTVLDLTDDAAHSAWGDDWRMPTKEEVAELMNTSNCTWTWTEKNGIPGYKVTSRKSGYTANSIFLPANGMKSGSSVSDGGTVGNYWTSSISAGYTYYAISPFFDSSSKNSDNCYRYFGLGIRPVQGAVVPVSSITIPETLTLIIGASSNLSATVLPTNATYKNLTWTSSDESIATVDANGKVTAVALGTATVTAYSADGGVKAECVVSSNQLAESITLDKTAIEIYVGDEPVTLTATVLPETTTDKSVTWTSSKTSVATVDEEGNITAVSNGSATITATAKDGSGKSATCSVTVKTHVESVSLDKTEITLLKGKSSSLTATVLPSTASNKSLTWTSSDTKVAIVSGTGSSVTVKGISLGNANITAASVDGEITALCNVAVNQYVQSISLDKTSLTIYVGDEPVTITATVLPEENTLKSVTWTSSKTSVATVDEGGSITAVANGTATITATAKDGSGAKATCSVTVCTHVESVSLNMIDISLYEGSSETLIASVLPSLATDKTVEWSSTMPTVATVETDGKVIGIKAGTATITATTTDGGYTANCAVTVIAPDYNGHEYVDLGLSVNWATCNVGADKPEDCGGYFAWGETTTKSDYDSDTYTGTIVSQLPLDKDAAHVNFGGTWRMPTKTEYQELIDNCTWSLVDTNTARGYRITSKKKGYENKSIFLPGGGYKVGTSGGNSMCQYWASTNQLKANSYADCLIADDSPIEVSTGAPYWGYLIRPVIE